MGTGGATNKTHAVIGEGFAAGVGGDGGEDVGVDGRAGSERGEGGFECGAAFGEAAEAGDVFGEFFEDDFSAARGEGGEFVCAEAVATSTSATRGARSSTATRIPTS